MPSPFGGFRDDSPDLRFVEMAFLSATENGSVGRRVALLTP